MGWLRGCVIPFLGLGLIVLQLGCTPGRSASKTTVIKERSSSFVISKLESQKIQVPHLNGKAKIKFDDGSQKFSFNANIRIKRDTKIWINASFLGYEVARILFRPDSIFFINRLEKTYLSDSYHGFNQTFEMPATFGQLQDLLYGNVLLQSGAPTEVEFQKDRYQISQRIDAYYVSHQIDALNYLPKQIEIDDSADGYHVAAMLDSYKSLEKIGDFSYIRHYIIENDNVQIANIQINFVNVDTDRTKKTPFEIPGHYSKAD